MVTKVTLLGVWVPFVLRIVPGPGAESAYSVHIHPSTWSIIVVMVTVGLAFISALVAWSGTAALAAYAQRRPGVAAIAWLIAALGLTVGLSAAVIGALFDFGGLTFRLLQIGVSLIGPLYMAWGALEYGIRAPGVRFSARLALSAFTIVPLVVFSMDRVSAQFGSSFPAFADHYDLIPRVLANAVLLVVLLFLVPALVMVARRDSDDRGTDLTVLGLIAVATLLSVAVGRFGLGVMGPLFMLGAVSALWGAGARAARSRRDEFDDGYEDDEPYDDYDDHDDYGDYGDYDYDYDGHDDHDDHDDGPREEDEDHLKEPERRGPRNTDPYDALYGGPPPGSQGEKMCGVITIYTLVDNHETAFDQISDAVAAAVAEHEPDTLLYACHTVPSAPQQRIVYAIYRNRRAKEKHEHQPHTLEFVRRTAGFVTATNVIELSLSGVTAKEELTRILLPR